MPSGAREARGAAARREAATGVCKWSEAGPRRRRRRPGADGYRPRRQGAPRSLPVFHGVVRGSRCPGAGGGPGALGVHAGWREAFVAGRGLQPEALAAAPGLPPFPLANVTTHADSALASLVSCAEPLEGPVSRDIEFSPGVFTKGKE